MSDRKKEYTLHCPGKKKVSRQFGSLQDIWSDPTVKDFNPHFAKSWAGLPLGKELVLILHDEQPKVKWLFKGPRGCFTMIEVQTKF